MESFCLSLEVLIEAEKFKLQKSFQLMFQLYLMLIKSNKSERSNLSWKVVLNDDVPTSITTSWLIQKLYYTKIFSTFKVGNSNFEFSFDRSKYAYTTNWIMKTTMLKLPFSLFLSSHWRIKNTCSSLSSRFLTLTFSKNQELSKFSNRPFDRQSTFTS